MDESGILSVSHQNISADYTDTLIIDAQGKTISPGLFDCHVHLGLDPRHNNGGDVSSTAMLCAQIRRVWQYGITTVRNCGTKGNLDIRVRNMVDQGIIPGCRIVACGESISITGGHAYFLGIECDTVEETIKATRKQLREGAKMIKLFATGGMMTEGSDPLAPQLTHDQMAAAVREAHARGAITCAHATGLEGAKHAIRAGVRSIEHTMLDTEAVQMMKEKGTYYCSTLGARQAIHRSTSPRLSFVRSKCKPDDMERMINALRLCREHGVTIAAGTDAADDELLIIGPSLANELILYREAGYTPLEILRSATSNAADMCLLQHVTGRLIPGLSADVIMFDKDPIEDISHINTVCMTFQGGIMRYKKDVQM